MLSKLEFMISEINQLVFHKGVFYFKELIIPSKKYFALLDETQSSAFYCVSGVLIETALEFFNIYALVSSMINNIQILGLSIWIPSLCHVIPSPLCIPTSTPAPSLHRLHNVCITFRPELDHFSRNCSVWKRGVRLYSDARSPR